VDRKRGCAGLHYNCLLAADGVRTLRVGLCERQQRRDRHLRQHELDIPPSLDNVAPLLPLGDLTIGGECCCSAPTESPEGGREWRVVCGKSSPHCIGATRLRCAAAN
jgi:hypothetical protein